MTESSSRPPGRAGHGLRDMVMSLLALLVLVGGIVGLTKGCSFSPGGPSVDPGALPSVDASSELRSAATRVGFPLRGLAIPAGWHANAATVSPVGSGASATVAVRVGLITDAGNYLRLSQSDASVPVLVVSEAALDTDTAPRATGDQQAAGTTWTVYPGRPGEQTWVAKKGDVEFVITGSGTAAEKRTLAAAAFAAPVLPAKRG